MLSRPYPQAWPRAADKQYVPSETQQRADPTYNDFRHAVGLAQVDPEKSGKILNSLFTNNPVAMRSYVLGWFQGKLTDAVAEVLLPRLDEHKLLAPLLLDPNALPESRAAKLAQRASEIVEGFNFEVAETLAADASNSLRAVNILATLPLEKGMVPLLIDRFVEADSDVQAVIATIVGQLEPDLRTVEVILSGGEAEVRANLIETLLKTGHEQLGHYMFLASGDPDGKVRAKACAGLLRLDDQRGGEILKQMLRSPDATHKLCATTAVTDLGDEQFEPQLRKLLREPDMALRRSAQQALAQISAAKTRKRHQKRAERSSGVAKRPESQPRRERGKSTGSVSNSWRLIRS